MDPCFASDRLSWATGAKRADSQFPLGAGSAEERRKRRTERLVIQMFAINFRRNKIFPLEDGSILVQTLVIEVCARIVGLIDVSNSLFTSFGELCQSETAPNCDWKV